MAGRDRHLHASGLLAGVRAEIKPEPFDPEWKGGFFCPCHKSRYDIAGRVFQGVPAPANLVVPPYKFVDDNATSVSVSAEGSSVMANLFSTHRRRGIGSTTAHRT